MSKRFPLIVLTIVFAIQCYAQTSDTKQALFEWTPNPTEFIRQNHETFLTTIQYKDLLKCKAVWFDAEVDVYNGKLISVNYSKFSTSYNKTIGSPDLNPELAKKIGEVLLLNIKVSRGTDVVDKEIPKDTFVYSLSLDFNEKDKRKASKLK
jgi:hypothetical protein